MHKIGFLHQSGFFLVFTLSKKIGCILVFRPLNDNKGPFWFLWVLQMLHHHGRWTPKHTLLFFIQLQVLYNMLRGPALLPWGIMREEVFLKSKVNSVFTFGYPFLWPQLCSAPSQFVSCGSRCSWSDLHRPLGWDRWYISLCQIGPYERECMLSCYPPFGQYLLNLPKCDTMSNLSTFHTDHYHLRSPDNCCSFAWHWQPCHTQTIH